MGIYEDLGVTPIINLWGTATVLGGSLVDQEVREAMLLASQETVMIDELQAAASKIISEITGAESGYVSCGCASGLTLGTAACIAGMDITRMERLPDTTGMPNEVIMARDQRNGWDHAIRAAGAKIVEAGMDEANVGGMRQAEAWEFEAAINENTAAICLVPFNLDSRKEKLMDDIIAVAKKHEIPVIIDAAASVPPIENLRRFISMGGDLVAYSGGKAIRGPQNTGILCGRRDLIASVALQHLDMIGYAHTWNPPETLIPKDKLVGKPRQGIGRCQKVNKESIVGLLARLRSLTKEKTISEAKKMHSLIERILGYIKDIPHITTAIANPASNESGAMPALKIKLDSKQLGKDAFDVSSELKSGNPRLFVNEKSLHDNILIITTINLNQDLADIVGKRLREVLKEDFDD